MMKKILIVDDNDANLYLLKSLLEEEGFDVTAAKNGQEALDMAHADPPDLIVSDILMPVMDGYMLCRKCKSDEQLLQIPFIFYTATYTEPKDEKFALSLGADRFVLKPQEPEILLTVLKEVWEERSETKPAAPKPLGEEMEFFRQYNEILFRKLEKKISDLETANRKLKCLEEQYRLSFENVTDIVWTIDANFNVQKLSPSVERMLGYKPQDFIGRSVFDLVKVLTPESMERAMAEIRLVLSGQTIPASVYSLVARGGTIKHGEFSGSPILRDGELVGMVSVIRDITERKQTEEKVRQSEKKYRELFDFLPIPVYEMDFEANITSANRAIYEAFRGTEEDLKKGFKAWQLLSPEDIDKSNKNIEHLLKGKKLECTEYNLKRLDGSVFPAIVVSSVIYSDGKPVGLRGAIVDITERRQQEEALRESEERYRNVFEYHAAVKFLIDPDTGNIIEANEAAVNYYGWPHEQLQQMKIQEINALPDEDVKEWMEKARTKKQTHFEFRHRRADGSIRDVEVFSSRIEVKRKDLLHSIVYDITDRKRAEERVKETLDSLRKAVSTTIRVMVSTVETRDPYTAGHQLRSADLARAIATEMGLPKDRIDGIRMAGSIHDIGKLSIPSEIMIKPTRLSEIEFSLIKVHARRGYEILKDVESSWPLAEMVYQHHERMDGSGYPRNLKGDDIIMEARILAVADVVEAMASHRPYRPAIGINKALDEIAKNRGFLYDPEVVDACLKIFNEKGYQILA